MSNATAAPPGTSPSKNDQILFWASFATLIAAGIGFSVRGVVLEDWGRQFGFTQSELGTITGGGLVGFGLAIIFFSFFADLFGYGKLMLVAFLLHLSSAVLTFAATPVYEAYGKAGAFWCLNAGMWLFALGNGTCEAVINPLTASLFPRQKTHWLNILHAGWPLGLILGVVITLGFEQVGTPIRWEFKLGVFLIPVLLYGMAMFNRPFPRSEASTAGVPLTSMMSQIGMLGFTLAAAFIGLALANLLPTLLGAPGWLGWIAAVAVWAAFGWYTNFGLGVWMIAFLYVMQALVGYVELGTDSWITNITKQVLKSGTNAQLAFIWTNVLMFTLRFFAGPIVHRINPIGLLFVSALLGTLGLYLLGQDFTDSVWPWVAAVTVYGIGKTFYWPTLLGVLSERFPKGGALALGIGGGIGMLSAGLLGGPGIGYKQDYFAVEKLKALSPGTYDRYMARKENGEPEASGYPIITAVLPNVAPAVAGIDNAKFKVFEDYTAHLSKIGATSAPGKDTSTGPATTLEADLQTLEKEKKAGHPVEAKLETELTERYKWWQEKGLPNYLQDKVPLEEARLYGSKQALLYTAIVPALLAVGFLLLIGYFVFTGGYKQVHLTEEPPMGEY